MLFENDDRFDIWQKAKTTIQIEIKISKYDFVIRRSNTNRQTEEVYKVQLVCNRNAICKSRSKKKQRQRNINIKKCACFFKINITKYKNKEHWQKYVKHVEHNHDVFVKFRSQTIHRRIEMIEEMLNTIAKATTSLQTSKQIHINIRKKNFFIDITIQNVYNVKKKIKHRRLSKYIFTQVLLKILTKNNWFVKFQLNTKSKRMKRLFFVNKHIKKIFNKNFEMLIMNCIYKINKYRMSLLIVMNVIALRNNFYIVKIFLNYENEKSFNWVIEQI